MAPRIATGLARVRARLGALSPEGLYLFLADYAEELITFLLAPEHVVPLLQGCI